MPQHAIELILTRRLTSNLSMPTFMVDSEGHVLDFNAAAREVLGERLETARTVTARELASLFEARDPASGERLAPEALPIVIALEEHHPAHARLRVIGAGEQPRDVAVTAVPLVGQGDRFLGAIAFFWPADGPAPEASA